MTTTEQAMMSPDDLDGPASHPADRLLNAIDDVGAPVCVGFDPVVERLPSALQVSPHDDDASARAIEAFGMGVLDAVAGTVPCVKFQSACFERYGAAGVATLARLRAAASDRSLQVILDAKRGDIGISAAHYAVAAFDTDRGGADWITVNGYLGAECLEPFVPAGCGAFALVRTSNPGSDEVQRLTLEDGRTVAEAMADVVAQAGAAHVGTRGYSSLGAVVGATKASDARALRERMPNQIFLVPGYGAQGGGPADVLPCFNTDGTGAIVTASRSVIYAFDPDAAHWTADIATAARRLAAEVGEAVRDR